MMACGLTRAHTGRVHRTLVVAAGLFRIADCATGGLRRKHLPRYPPQPLIRTEESNLSFFVGPRPPKLIPLSARRPSHRTDRIACFSAPVPVKSSALMRHAGLVRVLHSFGVIVTHSEHKCALMHTHSLRPQRAGIQRQNENEQNSGQFVHNADLERRLVINLPLQTRFCNHHQPLICQRSVTTAESGSSSKVTATD
jgi:hypothetical protein